MLRIPAAAVGAALLLCGSPVGATELTLDQALALARERAPAIAAARARIDEARGRATGAAIPLRDNPIVDVAVGSRGGSVDAEVGIGQNFELGGQPGARREGAAAGVDAAVAAAEDATRLALRDVGVAFYRGVHAEERVRLAASAEEMGAAAVKTAERRHQLGDVAVLDLNVARTGLARARSDRMAAEAARDDTLARLRTLLGVDAESPLAVRGDLRDRRRVEPKRPPDRPDLRALAAEAREADAEVRLGEGQRWPELGLGARYQREEGTDAVLGTLTLTLPIFERGQGLRAEAGARARRLRLELDARRRAAAVEVRAAGEIYRRRIEAAEELERGAMPLLEENETLARRSYEAGQVGLAELLLIRREVLDTRTIYLDRLLEAAIAGIELEAAAGALP